MIVYKEIGELSPPSRSEIMRYMGCNGSNQELECLIDACLSESASVFSFRLVYKEFPLHISADESKIGELRIQSKQLSKCLSGCTEAIIFAATAGIGIDRLIMRYGRTNPSKALCLQAIGAERSEELCNTFCREIKEQYKLEGKILRPRFSPGYGDLPLELQREIFRLLDCERSIGLTLNDSLLMSPTKSVTAIIGIKNIGENENT